MLITDKWEDYELLAAGHKEKVERWGKIIIRRPDPSALWNVNNTDVWQNVHAVYHRNEKGGGCWEIKNKFPESWIINYKDLKFKISLTGFKHTLLFPEQASNWDYMIDKIKKANREVSVLNLFAYTGGATIACAKAGANVTHVDAAKGINEIAKENAKLNAIDNSKIRYIVDDAIKFVEREIRRGKKYDAIVMDPPSYGRGPNKELWKFEDKINELIEKTKDLLSNKPLFFILNTYSTSISEVMIKNIMSYYFKSGTIDCGELVLPVSNSTSYLPCGIYARWEK